MVIQFGSRRTPPQPEHDDLEGGDLIGKREEEHQEFQPVVLAAGGQKDRFVAQPQQGQSDDQRHHQNGIDQTEIAAPRDRSAMARCQQRPYAGRQNDHIQADVKNTAGVAAGERNFVRPGRKTNCLGPQPIQESSDRRPEPRGERARPATQPQHLEQQREDDELLVHDRLRPPGRDIPQSAQTRGQRNDRGGTCGVGGHLEHVEQIDRRGRAKTVFHPMPGDHLHPVGGRQRMPGFVVDVWKVRGDESHDGLVSGVPPLARTM